MSTENQGPSEAPTPSHDQPQRVPNPPMASNSMPLIGDGCAVVLAGLAIAIVLIVRLS